MIPQFSRRSACIAVLMLTAFALAIRFAGIRFYLPHGSLGDESIYASFFLTRDSDPRLDPAGPQYYPQLVTQIARLFRHDSHAALDSLADHIARASADVLLLREIVACISVLIVPATYLLARHFLERTPSVLAAGLASASFFGLWFSEQARPHAAFAALSTLTLLGALEVRRRGDLRAWICAGLACALAMGVLQTGCLLLGSLAVAYWLSKHSLTKRSHLLPFVAIALITLSVFAFYPWLFDAEHGAPLRTPLVTWVLANLTGKGVSRSARALWEYEPWLSSCAAIGAAVMCWNVITRSAPSTRLDSTRLHYLVIVAAFVLPAAFLFGIYQYTHQRYLLPFVPILACCAAGGFQIACERIAERRGQSAAHWFIAAASGMFAVQAACALALVRVRAADDTAEQAADWITNNVERGRARIAVRPGVELPLLCDQHSDAWLASFAGYTHNAWLAYETHLDSSVRASLGWPIQNLPLGTEADRTRLLADPDRYVDELPAEFVVFALPDRGVLRPHLRSALQRRGKLVARFSPWRFPDDDERPFLRNEWDDPDVVSGNWVWHSLRARCLGPVIEIYRIHAHER